MTPDQITHRRVLRVAVPIVISNATIPILGAVDTGVVGQLGAAVPIGAVGIGAVIVAAIYWMFGFLRMGTSGLVAQARGAGDADEASAILARGLLIALAGGVGLLALQPLVLAAGFWIAPASAEVEALARAYLSIRFWGSPAAISVFALTGWLIAMERTRAVLGLQVLMNALNISLDLWFVLGLGWGVEGVAVATVLSEWSAVALGVFLARHELRRGVGRWALVLDSARLARMARVNADILLRTFLLQAIMVSFSFLASGMGDRILAADQILLQFLYITAYALDGFAFAAEALVGAALGARRRDSLRRAAVRASQWAGGVALVLSAGFALGGGWMIDIMTTAEPVRETARIYLPYVALAPVFGVSSWMLDGVFIGATRTAEMRNAMLQTVVLYVALLVPFVTLLGNHGLWAALLASYILRTATLWRYYPRIEAEASAE